MTFVISRMHFSELLNTKIAAEIAAIPKVQNIILTGEDCWPKKGYMQQKRPIPPPTIADLDNLLFIISREETISTIRLSSILYPYYLLEHYQLSIDILGVFLLEKQEKNIRCIIWDTTLRQGFNYHTKKENFLVAVALYDTP